MRSERDLILVVDDEPDIAAMLESYLEHAGYDVVCASDGAQALRAVGKRAPDLVLLDVGLPDMDGTDVCRCMRSSLDCPIVFLTARVEDADELEGFAAGGDDYVTKPFSLEALGARVSAHLARERRRERGARARAVLHADRRLSIDLAACRVLFDGAPVTLARKEFEICALLAKHPGQVFDRDRIYELVWGEPGASQVVTEHVRRLRAALAKAGAERDYVETVWGMGYRWAG